MDIIELEPTEFIIEIETIPVQVELKLTNLELEIGKSEFAWEDC